MEAGAERNRHAAGHWSCPQRGASMLTIRPRRTAALLVVLSLFCVAFPAVAAPEPTRDGLAMEPGLPHKVMNWLTWLWPPDLRIEQIHGRLGPDADPGGEPSSVVKEPISERELKEASAHDE